MLRKPPVTLKHIARKAGVSLMTVSRALRNQSNISAATRERVQRIADELGYRPNPLVSALMSYRQRARPIQAHLSLAFVTNFPTRDEWKSSRLYSDFFTGARQSADRHGYRLEEFWLREPGMTARSLSQILHTRNISGLVIAPLPVAQGHLNLDWEKFSAVTFGYSLAHPLLHRAANHQFRSMRLAMRHLRKLGYQRLGLALPASLDGRVDHQWAGSFMVEQQRFQASDRVPLLVIDDVQWNYESFAAWFRKHAPDVIISQEETILEWLAKLGARVPDDVGYVHLNCSDQHGRLSGIYQNGPTVGMVAVDFVVSMVQRNERGLPELPHSILVEGTWVDGGTLKRLAWGR